MSEKKHTTANTQSGSEEAFTSIDHIVLSDQVTAISITSNKIRFMIKRMLDTSDDISQDYDDGMGLMKNANIGEKLAGYTDILYDLYLRLDEQIGALEEKIETTQRGKENE